MLSWSRGAAGAALAALLGGWAVAALAPRDFTVGTFQDDAQYAVLAKAIRERHTYRSLEYPGHPYELKFPPGWPAVLSLVWKPDAGGPENLQRLRWVNLALVGPLAAARALLAHSSLGARQIVERSLEIAADICIFTNRNLTVVELE